VRRDLPSGTVTFLFTDVEGSTKLLHELGSEGYADALAEHRRVIRDACAHELDQPIGELAERETTISCECSVNSP
jgi:hypothetical protein